MLVGDDAEAKKKGKKKKKCKGNKKKCGKKCIPKTNCCSSADCGGGGATCQGGTCLCPTGQNDCDGECIPEDDCCPACSDGAICDGGVCVCAGESFSCGASECCEGEVCAINFDPPSEICEGGGCPSSNYCVDEDFFRCGPGDCACITSVEDENACTDLDNVDCTDCTSDQQCTTALGQDALCIPNGEFCTQCSGNTNFCVATGCPSGGGGGSCPETDFCIDPATFTCGAGAGCVCTNTVDPAPEHACVENPLTNPQACNDCVSNADCGAGEVCIASGEHCGEECGAAFCVALCAEGALMAAEHSGGRSLKDGSAAKGSGGTRGDHHRHGQRKRRRR
jgi:hypothetical protein